MQEQRWAEIAEEEGHIDLAAQGYMGVFFLLVTKVPLKICTCATATAIIHRETVIGNIYIHA